MIKVKVFYLPTYCAGKVRYSNTFYPVILHNGKIVGNWNKTVKKDQTLIETTFLDPKYKISKEVIEKSENRYKNFIGNQ